MPELPEVETIKTILDPIVKKKTVKSLEIIREKTLITDPNEFAKKVVGKTFTGVSRKGKFLIFHLSDGLVIISHLRMEGKYFEGRVGDPLNKHDLLVYNFTDGTRLVYNDQRKFGIIGLYKESEYLKKSPLSELGKEPFELSPQELYDGLKTKKKPIKEALLDQTLISGLGNIYDDEVLFAASINPKTSAKDITLAQCAKIIKESIRILNLAIAAGGSTIRSYHPKEGVSGEMQNNLLAYGKKNEPCPRCGFPMRKIVVGGRGTTYCPHCQHLNDHPFVLAVTGPVHSGKSTVAAYFEKKGYVRIDADKIVHALYLEPSVLSSLQLLLGKEAVQDGKASRSYIAKLISENIEKKKALEQFIHPLVLLETKKRLAALSDKDKVVLDVPLLFGSGLDELADFILVIASDEAKRKMRLSDEGKDVEKAFALNKGWPLGRAKNEASLVIENNGSIKELENKLDKVKFL